MTGPVAPTPAGEQTLTVSVIIPSYHSAKTLRACLESVYAQTYPPAEVIVVDDASTDDSPRIAQEFPCQLLAFEVNRGAAAARNAGAAAATGAVLFFVDSDIGLAPDAIDNAVRALREDPDRAMVQGIYDWRPLIADSRVEIYKTLSEHFWRKRAVGESAGTLFALSAVRRQVFEEVGGFREGLTDIEDLEFGTRLPARYVIWTSDEVVGRHDDVDRFWPYLVEHLRRAHKYGGLLTQIRRTRPRHPDPRPRRVDLAAVTCMASCVLVVLTLPLAVLSGWLLLVPLALLAGFAVVERRLFRFVRRERGLAFLGYVVAMQFLMYTTQFAGMLTGVLHGQRATRIGAAPAGPGPELGR